MSLSERKKADGVCDGFLLSKKSYKSTSKTPSNSATGVFAKKGFFKKIKAKFGLSSDSSKNSRSDEDVFRDEKREKDTKNADAHANLGKQKSCKAYYRRSFRILPLDQRPSLRTDGHTKNRSSRLILAKHNASIKHLSTKNASIRLTLSICMLK